jgi:dihydrofolate reductase
MAPGLIARLDIGPGAAAPFPQKRALNRETAMKASVFVGTSLDGYLARPDGAYDFLPADGGEPHGYEEFFASVDALVIGRNTYEVVLPITPWIYSTKPVFVLSTHPLKPPPTDAVVERMSGSPQEIAATLTQRGFQHIYVDGGLTIQSFLRAGLIQRLTLTRVPVLVGHGIPLFGPTERDIMLKHIATQHYATGLVKSEYEVMA